MAQNRYLLNISPKVWTVLSFWFHVAIGGVMTEYVIHHTTNVRALLSAGGAALLPVVYRYFNPSDTFPAPNPALIAADAQVQSTTADTINK
jgi:hypothetical protein